MADVDRLFDEFAAAYVRGEHPDLPGYLARAGDGADELARLVDVFLRVAPAPEASDEDTAVMHARLAGEPGLLALRNRRSTRVDEVVAGLAGELGVEDRARLKRYYQRLEGGLLDPHRVDQRVWDALRGFFRTNVRNVVRPVVTGAGASAMAYYRRPVESFDEGMAMLRSMDVRDAAPAEKLTEPPADPPPAERDELDRLFLGET